MKFILEIIILLKLLYKDTHCVIGEQIIIDKHEGRSKQFNKSMYVYLSL